MAGSPESPDHVITLDGPARLGIISDTHVFDGGARQIAPQVHAALVRMAPTLIVHVGDICAQSVIDRLGEIAPVLAVRGNNDAGVFGLSLPMTASISCLGRTIRVLHGHGGRSAKVVAQDATNGADCVIYGHSHQPDARVAAGTLFLNPGSPNDRRWHPDFGIAYLDITERGLAPTLLVFRDPLELDAVTFQPLARS